MKQTQLACYALLASAFVLAGVLLVQLQDRSLLPEAQGDMVVTRANLTVMTAMTRRGEESVFVLDDRTQTLLVYRFNLPRRQFELRDMVPLAELFETAPGFDRVDRVTPQQRRTPR